MQLEIEACDIILFNRPCLKMDPVSSCICASAKGVAASSWDHVGVVVEDELGKLYILEVNMTGVTRRPLYERISRSRSNEIAVRKLVGPRTSELKSKLWAISEELLSKNYNLSLLQMVQGVSMSYLKHGTNKRWVDRDLLEFEKSMIEKEMPYLQEFPIARCLLILRLSQLQQEIIKCKIEEDLDSSHDATSQSSFFCSQLVGSVLFRAGIGLCTAR